MRLQSEKRSGQVALLVAMCFTAVMGVLAITVDGGLLFDHRRRAQAAADAAALAAADDLYNNYRTNKGKDTGGTAKASALSTASANGFNNDGTTNSVTVNIPPKSGNHANVDGYAEVIIQYNQKRVFSGVFGSGTITVKARAVARGQWVTVGNGIIALDPTASGAVSSGGSAGTAGGINVVGGASIIVDSNSSSAVSTNGGGNVSVTGGGAIDVTGNYSGGGISPTPTTGVKPTADPFGYLPMPNATSLGLTKQTYNGGTQTLNPGIYVGGISVSGQNTLTLNPGIYYMQGGDFTTKGGAGVTGNGVLIYSDTGTIDLAGGGNISITPLTTGPYAGFSLMVNRTSNVTISLTGSGSARAVGGTIYGAEAAISLGGNGALNLAQIVGGTVSANGNGAVTVNSAGSILGQTRLLGLVE
jgi:hypothetical protein